MEEQRKQVNEEWKDDRPFFVQWDSKQEKWILNIKDPKTNEVIEKKIFMNGSWRKIDQNVVRTRGR